VADADDLSRLVLDGRTLDAQVREALTSAELVRTVEGASTLELGIADDSRKLMRSGLFSSRVVARLDGALFELVQVRKSGGSLSVTLEDATVADLRRAKGVLTAKEGTTSVDGFARRLVSAAPGAKLVAQAGPRILVALMRGSEQEPDEDSWSALGRFADDRGWRVFADRGTVYFGSDDWLTKRSKPVVVRENVAGVEEVEWDADGGKPAAEGRFTVYATRYAASPGTPVQLVDEGLGSGLWLVQETRRSLFTGATDVTLTRRQPALPEPRPEPRDDGQPTSAAPRQSGVVGPTVAGPVSSGGYTWPVSGRLTSGFGPRRSPGGIGSTNHGGVDVAVPIGTPIVAARAGTVAFAGTAGGYGVAVYLDHGGGMTTRYGHLSRALVRRGQAVAGGERIALSGNTGTSTGPHLHFEVRRNGTAVDPLRYLPRR
jgi:murein DD-endopeptidase MepM/ murein hydrolase activator NlpD